MKMHAPKEISNEVTKFAMDIAPSGSLEYIDVATDPAAKPGECFLNCKHKVARDGGSIYFGWAIWDGYGKFLEAEHHAVWGDSGARLCISPHADGSSRVLFLHDPEASYDFADKRSVRASRFRNVTKFKLVDDFISARKRRDQFYADRRTEQGTFLLNEQNGDISLRMSVEKEFGDLRKRLKAKVK